MHVINEGFSLLGSAICNIDEVPTLLFNYSSDIELLDSHYSIVLDRYRKVNNGFNAIFITNIQYNGYTLPCSLDSIRIRLIVPECDQEKLHNDIQTIIHFSSGFNLKDFYVNVFCENKTPPGGKTWGIWDVALAMNVNGTGRLDPLSHISACTFRKINLTGYLRNKTYFSKIVNENGRKRLANIEEYPVNKTDDFKRLGADLHYHTKLTSIRNMRDKFWVFCTNATGELKHFNADIVFVTCAFPASMEIGLAENGVPRQNM